MLPLNIEKELVKYCLIMEEKYFGLRASDIKLLAYQLAIQNNIPHPFSNDTTMAGKKWLKNFLERHPILSFRKPESTSLARVKGFTKEHVESFYNILENELTKVNFNPCKVFNVDETGISIVQHKQTKIIGLKGKKQVSKVTSAERGSLMTLVTCMSASGIYVPPLIIFPRKNMKAELLNGTPPGTISACHPSGWIQMDIFTQWFQHFMNHVKPSILEPVVLILDGHYSHTRNLDVIDLGRKHGVIIICLPPHSTHKLQPLDVSFMGPFKHYYSLEIENWLKNNEYRSVTAYQVGELMGRAYMKASTIENAVNGFRKTGIIPFNPNIFQDHEFVAETTIISDKDITVQEPTLEMTPISPECNNSVSIEIIGPFEISPPPTLTISNNKRKNAGKSAVVTASPFKQDLENSKQALLCEPSTSSGITNNTISVKSKPKTVTRSSKRNLFQTKNKNKPSKKSKSSKQPVSSSDSDSDEDPELVQTDDEDSADEECLYCLQPYKTDLTNEKWIRCIKCFCWAHELCAGIDKGKWKTYTCDMCFEN